MDAQECSRQLKALNAQGDISRAVELCESEACSDNIECQRYLGWFYANHGDPKRASTWYRKAVLQGSAEAIEEYCKCALMIDAKGDRQKAIELCQAAPFSAYQGCQRYLAKAFFEEGDMDATLHWCLKLAEYGDAEDQLYVGTLYISRNEPQQALDFLKRAAMAGNARANQLAGEIYAYGLGVPRDEDIAMSYYKVGAEKGLVLSQVRLLHLRRSRDRAIGLVAYIGHLTGLILKGLFIKLRNPNDPRVVDIPYRS